MAKTITCTICAKELPSTLEQYGLPQAPLCVHHWNEYVDGKWTLSERKTHITNPHDPIILRGYQAPAFDGYTYEATAPSPVPSP